MASARQPALHRAGDLLDALARRAGASAPRLSSLLLCVLACAAGYGAAMGGWRVFEDDRWKLAVFGAIKCPLLILATTALVVPGFFVLNTVSGLRDDFREAMRAIIAGQAALTLALLSLAPVTQFVYASGVPHRAAVLTNAGVFAVSAVIAQIVMIAWYRPLIRKNRRHLPMLGGWFVLYAFVGTQMGWMLRPFIGTPGMAPSFFREDPFTNAYVEIARLLGF